MGTVHQEKELDRIKRAYEERKSAQATSFSTTNKRYTDYVIEERDKIIKRLMSNSYSRFEELEMIEIGAGSGGNLLMFHELGIPWNRIWGNELLPDRVEGMRKNLPELKQIDEGDACNLEYKDKFDLVFLSTVLTSILDSNFKKRLCEKVLDMTKPGGRVLIYDFIYNNPANPNVKGVGKKELVNLFDKAKTIEYYKTTVAPPIGRKIGGLYPLFNSLFPFLRTHLVTLITK